MSKLIRDNNESQSEPSSEAALLLPLSPTVVVKYLKACQNLTRDHIQKAFDHYVHSLLEAIDVEIDRARTNQDATEFMEIQRRIKKGAADLKHYFCGYYLEGFVKFSKKRLHTSIGSEDIQSEDELSIVENEDLEETIAISSITQRADTYFAEPIWALNQRFAILNNGEPVTEANNPVSPIQFCDALRRALKFVELNARSKMLAYKVFDYQLINLYRLVLEDVNQYLKEQGVLPNLKFTVPKGRVPESYLHEDQDKFGRRAEDHGINRGEEPNPEAPPEQYQQELVQAIRGLQHQLRGVGAVGAVPGGVPVSSEQLVNALQLLQQHNVDLPQMVATDAQVVTPLDISAIVESLKAELKGESGEDTTVEKQDMQTIDLVGMVFEYMLDDENIPATVKAVLSYLHTPFLKIAFVDPGFFERAEHPARVLLNTLADAGAKWVGNDGSSQFDMLNKIKSVVNKVIKDFDSDIKVITSLLFEFSTYVKTVSRKQELTEKRAKEKAEGEDKLREVKIDVNDAVRSRTRDKELPSAILLLLLQPWSDYLTFILLRHGKQSEAWQSGIQLVDDVIWCIQPKESSGDRERLERTVESVVTKLRKGFEVIGFDASKSQKLIEAFESMTDLAKQSQKVEPAPEPMRNELERIAAERAGHNAEVEEEVTPEEMQMVESLKMIEFGTWFEFDGGKRLKVAWYNGRTSHYMLVDQMGKRVDMVSGLILARQMIAGQAKIISGSSKPFFERALENIYQKLNEKAEAMPELQNASQ